MNAPVIARRARAFDPVIASAVCEAVGQGATLSAACEANDVSQTSFLAWAAQNPETAQDYARARQAKADLYADRVVPLAREARDAGSSHEVQAIKLEVDALKWTASKLNPNAYGDKLDVTSAGKALPTPVHQVDARVQSIVMMAAERMRLAQEVSDEAAGLLE